MTPSSTDSRPVDRDTLKADVARSRAELERVQAEIATLEADVATEKWKAGGLVSGSEALGRAPAGKGLGHEARGRVEARWIWSRLLAVLLVCVAAVGVLYGFKRRSLNALGASEQEAAHAVEGLRKRTADAEKTRAMLEAEVAAARGPGKPAPPDNAFSVLFAPDEGSEGAKEPDPDKGTDAPLWGRVGTASCLAKRPKMASRALREVKRINDTSPWLAKVREECDEAGVALE